jgi:hypothetical protein
MKSAKLPAAVILAGVLIAGAAGSQSYRSPDGRFGDSLGRLEWESSCRKPLFYLGDDESAFADYQIYVACLRRQTENDARYAAEQVRYQASEELRRVNTEGQLAGVLSY